MVIKIKDLTFKYRSENIVQNLNAEFREGKVNYLIGYNGAGKSTLFDLISDLQTNYSGKIEGVPAKKDILYQTQNPVIFGALTGKDLQDFIFGIASKHEEIIFQNLTPRFQKLYSSLLDRKVGDMSVGERRWLLLFLESKLNKKLFLLDEPLSGVDPVSKVQIEAIINSLVKNKHANVVVTTHELNYLSKNDCFIHLLHDGKVKSYDSYDKFIQYSNNNDPEEAFAKIVGE